MEYNSYWFNQLVGTVYFDLVNINEIGVRQLETFVFNGVSSRYTYTVTNFRQREIERERRRKGEREREGERERGRGQAA